MRWSVALTLGAALAAGSIGCRNHDKVESQLRARERTSSTSRASSDRSEFQNGLLLPNSGNARLARPDGVVERPSEPYPVRCLRLGRGTRGRPGEHIPGDDALEVMVEPVDCDSRSSRRRAASTSRSGGIDRRAQDADRNVGHPPDQLRRTWQSGLFNTGYKLTLPWKVWPNAEKLRVVGSFQDARRAHLRGRSGHYRSGRAREIPTDDPDADQPRPVADADASPEVGPAPTPVPSGDRSREIIPKPDGPDPVLPTPTPDMAPAPDGSEPVVPRPTPDMAPPTDQH